MVSWLFVLLVKYVKGASWSQSFNSPAIISTFKAIIRPKLLVPHQIYDRVSDIDTTLLKAIGVRGLIFDKDNTITIPYGADIPPHIIDFLQKSQKVKYCYSDMTYFASRCLVVK
jgi:hypothetical protein